MTARRLTVLLDCGDTLIDEGTEVRDDSGVVLSGELVPGADRMVRDVVGAGFRTALVADGRDASFENLLTRHGLLDLFETLTCSEAVGAEKPSARMFHTALDSLGLAGSDASHCVMVGNNLARDIAGANRVGIMSIHLAWTDRYPRTPAGPDETPDHTISTPTELLPLLRRLEDASETSR